MANNSLQRELILENYRNPQNNSVPQHYSHSHKLANLSCGDEITVYLDIADAKLRQINYEVNACAICLATASLLSQDLPGKLLSDISALDQEYVEELLDTKLSISRVKCALLPLRTIQQAAGLKPIAASF